MIKKTCKMTSLYLQLIFVICLMGKSLSVQCPDESSTVGTEFVFGVLGDPDTSGGLYVTITVQDDSPAKVRITAPFNNYDTTLTISNFTTQSIATTLMQQESGLQFKGIEVNSDKNITVAVNMYSSSYETEGFLVLPTSALSTRYVTSSYHPYSSQYNEILVVGTDSNTDVTFNYSTNNGQSFTTVNTRLQKFQTYQLQVAYHDISGAVVTSSKPIAVFSGSGYSQIPVGIGSYNYIVEQMIPTKYWTTRYIVTPIYPHNYFIIKVYSDEDNTEVHYYNSTNHFAVYMDRGDMTELLFGREPVSFISNKPIYIVQYLADNENMYGNPYMSVVQGESQFVDFYKFSTEIYDSDVSTIAITIKKENISGLLLNGKSISSWTIQTLPVAHPMEEYVTVFVNISYNSLYYLQHINGLKFGAVLYGLLDTSYSYGYPLQMMLTNLECNSFLKPTNGPVHFWSTPTHSHGNQEYHVGNGTWCFSCENMSHLQYCDKVTRCQTDNQVCFVQRYTRSENIELYRSGCMNATLCQTSGNQVNCQECCNGDFCNTAGCGDEGLPSSDNRGPICFDCEHHGGSEICQTVQMCRSNQVCKIEQYAWGNDYHKIMGCADYQMCKSKRDTHVDVRHAPLCSKCCYSDFCNMNCTAHFAEPIIG